MAKKNTQQRVPPTRRTPEAEAERAEPELELLECAVQLVVVSRRDDGALQKGVSAPLLVSGGLPGIREWVEGLPELIRQMRLAPPGETG